jgi:lipopolysaccharide biosynthesis regulator YciM
MAFIQKVVRAVSAGTARTPTPYECVTCGARYRVQYYVCPECGGFSIDPTADRRVDG